MTRCPKCDRPIRAAHCHRCGQSFPSVARFDAHQKQCKKEQR